MSERTFKAAERTPLRQAWSDYLVSDEYQRAAQTAEFSDAMFQSFAYAFAAGSLRPKAAADAERWGELKAYLPQLACRCNADDVNNGMGQWAVEEVQAEMARLEKERTA